MTRREPPPASAAYIRALATSLKTFYASQDEQIDRLRAVRTLTQPVALDDKYRLVPVEVRDNAIFEEIQKTAALLSVNRPSCKVTPEQGTNASDKAQENKTLRQEWTEEVLRFCGQRFPGQDAFSQDVDAVVGDGGGWLQVLLVKDLWKGPGNRYALRLASFQDDAETSAATKFEKAAEAAKKSAGPPFVIKCVDVRQIYPVWTSEGLSEMLEIQKRPLHSTLRQYGMALTKTGPVSIDELGDAMSQWEVGNQGLGGALNTVDFYAHWTPTHVTYVLDVPDTNGGTAPVVLDQIKHGYGKVPYFPAFGYTQNWFHMRKVGWSISESKRWLVEYRAFLRTVLANLAARDALGPLKLTKSPGSMSELPLIGDDRQPTQTVEKWDLRSIIELRPGEDLSPILFAPVADSLKAEIAETSKAIDEASSPRTPAVVGPGLEGAGFAVNTLISEGRIRHDPLSTNIERQLCDVTRLVWRLMRTHVKEVVYVRSHGESGGFLAAGPDDLTDDVGLDWELKYELPSAQLIQERGIHERLEKGTLNFDEAIDRMGDNADQIRIGKEIDRMRQSPWYQQFLDLYVLQKIGRGDLLSQANLASTLAQTGQPPQAALGLGAGLTPNMGALAGAPGGLPAAAAAMVAKTGTSPGAPQPSGPPVPPGPPGPTQPLGPQTGSSPGAVVPQQSAAAGIPQ